MKLNRKGVALGMAGLGMVAVLGGGAGVAFAATGTNGGGSGSIAPCAAPARCPHCCRGDTGIAARRHVRAAEVPDEAVAKP